MQQVYLKTRAQWRGWLKANHERSNGIWLVCYKIASGAPNLNYDAVVEEALCFGWIDSIVKKLDDARFVRKVTPRNDNSKWSAANMKRVVKLIRQGLMTDAGLKKIAAARKAGLYKPATPPKISITMPIEFKQALAKNKTAGKYFSRLAPSYRRRYIGWVVIAKKPETRTKRIRESIRMLEQGKKLGLK